MRNEEIDKLRFQGYGYKKIARLLRLSENTVKSYCRRHPFDKTQKVCLQCGKPIENTPQKREKKFCKVKQMLKRGLISSEEYAEIDTIIAKKYGLNSSVIYR